MTGIGNVGNNLLPNHLVVSALQNLYGYEKQVNISIRGCSQIRQPRQLRVRL